jgi:predicted amidohydrolase
MDILRISLVQYDVIWENPSANRLKLDRLLAPLKGQTDLILLPEMFTTGFSMNARELAEAMDDDSVAWMKKHASELNSAIAGSMIIKENDHFFNRFMFVTPAGRIDYYDKRHLFSMGDENQYFHPGNSRVIVNYLGWRIALFVCYDLRFPVWCRSVNDADLMLFTANWPEKRKIVWQTLTRARAIENQLYVACVNRTGRDGTGIPYAGDSTLIDPKGELLCDLNHQTDLVETSAVSLEKLNQFREKFPVGKDEDLFEIYC